MDGDHGNDTNCISAYQGHDREEYAAWDERQMTLFARGEWASVPPDVLDPADLVRVGAGLRTVQYPPCRTGDSGTIVVFEPVHGLPCAYDQYALRGLQRVEARRPGHDLAGTAGHRPVEPPPLSAEAEPQTPGPRLPTGDLNRDRWRRRLRVVNQIRGGQRGRTKRAAR